MRSPLPHKVRGTLLSALTDTWRPYGDSRGASQDKPPFRPGSRGRVCSHFWIVWGDHLGVRPTTRSGDGRSPSAFARSSDLTEMSQYSASVFFVKQRGTATSSVGLSAARFPKPPSGSDLTVRCRALPRNLPTTEGFRSPGVVSCPPRRKVRFFVASSKPQNGKVRLVSVDRSNAGTSLVNNLPAKKVRGWVLVHTERMGRLRPLPECRYDDAQPRSRHPGNPPESLAGFRVRRRESGKDCTTSAT